MTLTIDAKVEFKFFNKCLLNICLINLNFIYVNYKNKASTLNDLEK